MTIEAGETTFALRGWRAFELAKGAGVKVIYSGISSAWLGDLKRLPDLVAYLEHRNIAFALIESRPDSDQLDVVGVVAIDQPALFDGPAGDAA